MFKVNNRDRDKLLIQQMRKNSFISTHFPKLVHDDDDINEHDNDDHNDVDHIQHKRKW